MRSCLIDVDVISEEQLLASGLPYVWMVDGSRGWWIGAVTYRMKMYAES